MASRKGTTTKLLKSVRKLSGQFALGMRHKVRWCPAECSELYLKARFLREIRTKFGTLNRAVKLGTREESGYVYAGGGGKLTEQNTCKT
jgi:hypothetical protein